MLKNASRLCVYSDKRIITKKSGFTQFFPFMYLPKTLTIRVRIVTNQIDFNTYSLLSFPGDKEVL